MFRVVIWVESLSCAGILLLQWQGEKFVLRKYLKFCRFQHVHCASKNPISPKLFNRFSKSLPELEDVDGGHLGGKFQLRMYFTFGMERRKLCASTTFEILPLSICTLCQQKSYISKGVQPIFEIFAWARRCWGWAFGWKVSVAHVFYFWNWKAKILRIDNIWNFANLNLYTVLAKIIYLQKCSNDFRNLYLSSKMLRVGIWVEGFRCAGTLFCNSKGKTSTTFEICHFQFLHCASKNPVSPKVFNRFSKNLPELEDVEGGHLGGKSQLRRYFTFAMASWKVCTSTIFEILPISTCTRGQQKSYISKSIQPIFEIFAWARRCCWWAFGWKVSVAHVFYFWMEMRKFCASTTFEILPISTCRVCQENPISPKVINRFSKSLPQLEDVESWHLGGKFSVCKYVHFAMDRRKLCASTTFEIFPLSTCTLRQQKSYISKSVQPILEMFASARRSLGWSFGWKVSGAQVFCFCNGKLGENFAHRQNLKFCRFQPVHCTLWLQKSYISKSIQSIFEIFAQLEDVEGGHLGGKFQLCRYFTFAMARRKLCAATKFEILPI